MRLLSASSNGIAQALAALAEGLTVMHATETCYGFACDLSNPKAVERLFMIKQRPFDQPVSALFSSVEEAKKYVVWNEQAEKLADEFLPGPLTIILRLKSDAPHSLFPTLDSRSHDLTTHHSPSPTLGVRVSSHPLASELVIRFGRPISTTSANIHGKPSPYSIEEIVKQYEGVAKQPNFLIDSGILPQRKSSRIVDCTETSQRILRS